jgi:hypothetical protein
MVRQIGNVLLSVPERRHEYGKNLQSVKEILTISPVLDQIEKVLVGCRNDPEIDFSLP